MLAVDNASVRLARPHVHTGTTERLLHSRFHEVWLRQLGAWLGNGNDPGYTLSTAFETFPFPPGLTPGFPADEYADDPRYVAVAMSTIL